LSKTTVNIVCRCHDQFAAGRAAVKPACWSKQARGAEAKIRIRLIVQSNPPPESQTPAGFFFFFPQSSRIGFRAEASRKINATLARRSLLGAPFATSPTWDTPFCLHKPVSLSRVLHFPSIAPLVYRDHLAISYRDHAHRWADAPT
jgi:hypothetical protein